MPACAGMAGGPGFLMSPSGLSWYLHMLKDARQCGYDARCGLSFSNLVITLTPSSWPVRPLTRFRSSKQLTAGG